MKTKKKTVEPEKNRNSQNSVKSVNFLLSNHVPSQYDENLQSENLHDWPEKNYFSL